MQIQRSKSVSFSSQRDRLQFGNIRIIEFRQFVLLSRLKKTQVLYLVGLRSFWLQIRLKGVDFEMKNIESHGGTNK
ncbi:unnamed protein product [Paramecium octaurelia]|uniref:Uncharacterized protein n=1 Tax=Paramecium octaurelia TaxID=43137 RepID=A0A8S1XRV6_PAROT|nr:unnamed protein product [Paramecium octaurelia]